MKRFIVCLALLPLLLASPVWAGDYAGDYIIGDGDSLSIAVWGVAELSGQVVVRPDGKITLPAAGDITATGFTPVQLGQEITEVLGAYVKTPVVTVTVVGITNNRIYISGSGIPPRIVNLAGRTSLPELVATIAEAKALVCCDSASSLIAPAVGTPFVTLTGPTRPERTGPYGPLGQAVFADIPCIGCLRRSCPHASCMQLIDPARVAGAARAALHRDRRNDSA